MGPLRPNLTIFGPSFLQNVLVHMDSVKDFFFWHPFSLFWGSKLAIFKGFLTFPELRAHFQNWGPYGHSNEMIGFMFRQWSMVIKIFRNWGPISRIEGPRGPQFWKSGQPGTPSGKKRLFGGVKPKKNGPNFFYGFVIPIKNTFCKKNGPKRSIQPSAVTQTFYSRLYGVTTTN